jgi:hypothetical protein
MRIIHKTLVLSWLKTLNIAYNLGAIFDLEDKQV